MTRLTDRKIKSLTAKTGERYEVWDSGSGLGVRVGARRKSFIFPYRHKGRSDRITYGHYPEMSLSEARILHERAKSLLGVGINPKEGLASGSYISRSEGTVAQLCKEYLERHAKPNKRSWKADERTIQHNILPVLGTHKISHVKRKDVVLVLDRILARNAGAMANRTLALMSKIFNFGIERGLAVVNPCTGINRQHKEVKRDRILTETEIGILWRKSQGRGISESVGQALRLILLTAQRPGEVTQAQWQEFDLEGRIWTIPASRSKNGIANTIPLSKSTLMLLIEIREASSKSRYLFPSPITDGPINRSACARAIGRVGKKWGLKDFTPHDLRRTAASNMARLGARRMEIEKILNHKDNTVTGIYDRYEYLTEKRAALETWGEELHRIVSEET